MVKKDGTDHGGKHGHFPALMYHENVKIHSGMVHAPGR
jgi:hypothetical protein